LHENFLNIFLTFGTTNSKPNEYKINQMKKKESFSLLPFLEWLLYNSKFFYNILFSQMHYMKIAKRKCMHYFSIKKKIEVNNIF
jgi:hypothetical protein